MPNHLAHKLDSRPSSTPTPSGCRIVTNDSLDSLNEYCGNKSKTVRSEPLPRMQASGNIIQSGPSECHCIVTNNTRNEPVPEMLNASGAKIETAGRIGIEPEDKLQPRRIEGRIGEAKPPSTAQSGRHVHTHVAQVRYPDRLRPRHL